MKIAPMAFTFLALAWRPALACKCELSLDVCAETVFSNVIFTGTVESITPEFMTRWKPASPASVAPFNRALEAYLHDRSPARLSALKDAVRTAVPGLGAEEQRRLEKAATVQELSSLLTSVLDGNRRVHFRVRTVFRKAGDDDQPDDDDDEVPEFLDVLTPFGDCGNDFQIGETYLVYANSDEEEAALSTDVCSRTRRASDAGADLAYLSFYKDRKNPAGRVQGFTTFDLLYQVHPHEPEQIPLPAAGVIVALRSSRGVRYTPSNQAGQFVFDGLGPGDYTLTAYAAGFPESPRVLSGPQPVHLDERACATKVLVLLKDAP